MRSSKAIWCVRDRDDIWCAVKGGAQPDEAAGCVPTACGDFIALPHGFSKRTPTCARCRALESSDDR